MEIYRIKQISDLSEVKKDDGVDLCGPLLSYDEEVILSFKSAVNRIFFTNKRIIIVQSDEISKEFFFLFYSRMAAFSFETKKQDEASSLLKLWIIGLGEVTLEFRQGCDIVGIAELIGSHIK
ncbi:MAG: PH domain-containing protein [Bacteroidales bacterium]